MLSHFTRSRGEPQAAFPPSPCAKSDNMSSNKKSPPQGSAESKLYKAGLRSQYTLLLPLTSAHVLATPIYHALSPLSSACRFLSDKISPFVRHLVPQRPRTPRGNRGLLSHPATRNSARLGTRMIARMVFLACGASCLRRGGSPSYGDALHITAWQAGRLAYSLLCQGQAAVFCDRIRKISAVKHDP